MTKEVTIEKTITVTKKIKIDIKRLTDKIEDFFVDEELPNDSDYTYGDLNDDDYYDLLVLIGQTLVNRYGNKL